MKQRKMKQQSKHRRKSKGIKGISWICAASLLLAAPMTAYAGAKQQNTAEEKKETSSEEGKEGSKSETVYVQADAEGNAEKITVEEVLEYTGGNEKIADISFLDDIRNTKGEEEYSRKEDGTLLWENHGEDICYKGTSDQELPVSVKISYSLDGRTMNPEDMAGKSGRVKIRFDYENHTMEKVEVKGKEYKMKVPFLAFSAVVLSSEESSSVEITNGKVISQDGQYLAAGCAYPGLAQNLRLEKYEPTKDVQLPEYVEVSFDTESFSLDFTATILAPGIMRDMDLEEITDAEKLVDSMGELTEASAQLTDGVGELSRGMETLSGYWSEYLEGVRAADEGAKALENGLKILNEQKKKLQDGAAGLSQGLNELSAALEKTEIPAGDEADLSVLSKAGEALAADLGTLTKEMESLDGTLNQLAEFTETVSAYEKKVQESREQVGDELTKVREALTGVEAAAKQRAEEQMQGTSEKLKKELLDQIRNSLGEEAAGQMTEAVGQVVDQNLSGKADMSGITAEAGEQARQAAEILDGMPELDIPDLAETDVSGVEEAVTDIQKQLQVLEQFASYVSGMGHMTEEIGNALENLKKSVRELKTGSEMLTEGISSFNQGVEQLYGGSSALSSGMGQLSDGGAALSEGMKGLSEGMEQLEEGMVTFDKEGIQELDTLAGEELEEVLIRLQATKKADEAYENYGGIAKDRKGEVKFIIETEEIKE